MTKSSTGGEPTNVMPIKPMAPVKPLVQYLSIKQVQERYSIGRTTVYRWMRENELPYPIEFTKICIRWKLKDLEKWEAKFNYVEQS